MDDFLLRIAFPAPVFPQCLPGLSALPVPQSLGRLHESNETGTGDVYYPLFSGIPVEGKKNAFFLRRIPCLPVPPLRLDMPDYAGYVWAAVY